MACCIAAEQIAARLTLRSGFRSYSTYSPECTAVSATTVHLADAGQLPCWLSHVGYSCAASTRSKATNGLLRALNNTRQI